MLGTVYEAAVYDARVYYLIQPNLRLLWCDVSEYMSDRFAKDHPEVDIDLGRLEWQPAERPFDVETLRIALRYGSSTGRGLIVSGRDLVPLTYARDMQAIRSRDSTKLPSAAFFEQVMPGWTEQTRELDAKVDASMAQTRERAERELEQAMSREPVSALVEHWRALGGVIPNPL
ncbi:hypothetical protein [Mycobacteroides abscessus]|uniref:hypothetical protein n=1 Tax=Mycobacteroides abscessus TaxID=36809 RepID=UPI000940B472|nr:hypothetical protein [Mycobacteroides abscessus]